MSFNLWNEPADPGPEMSREEQAHAVRHVVAAIRAIDPGRLIMADGLGWGTLAMPELADLPIGQSCRGYYPLELTHYKADWVDSAAYPPPTWPIQRDEPSPELAAMYARDSATNLSPHGCNKADLEAFYQPWGELIAKGVGVHCGEMGAYNRAPTAWCWRGWKTC